MCWREEKSCRHHRLSSWEETRAWPRKTRRINQRQNRRTEEPPQHPHCLQHPLVLQKNTAWLLSIYLLVTARQLRRWCALSDANGLFFWPRLRHVKYFESKNNRLDRNRRCTQERQRATHTLTHTPIHVSTSTSETQNFLADWSQHDSNSHSIHAVRNVIFALLAWPFLRVLS